MYLAKRGSTTAAGVLSGLHIDCTVYALGVPLYSPVVAVSQSVFAIIPALTYTHCTLSFSCRCMNVARAESFWRVMHPEDFTVRQIDSDRIFFEPQTKFNRFPMTPVNRKMNPLSGDMEDVDADSRGFVRLHDSEAHMDASKLDYFELSFQEVCATAEPLRLSGLCRWVLWMFLS